MRKMLAMILAAAMLLCCACASAEGTFRVGMECNYAPYNWTQAEASDYTVAIEGGGGYADGYDVQIARKIAEGLGKEISVEHLAEIFLSLQAQGAHNINLVTPTHFADGIAEEIRTLGSLPGTVTLLQIDPNGYTVHRLLYQENGMYAIYDAAGGYRVFRAEDRLQYGAGGGPCCCLSFCWDSFVFCWARRCSAL